MILEGNKNDIKKDGDFSSKKATIDPDKLSKLQYILTKGLYSDPISAVIVEWANNGADSIISSGKDAVLNPVEVRITEDKFSVEDKGLGLNRSDFENICMSYLSSTKEDSNDVIGHFGIGLKSFLSLGKSATFTIRKDGKEAKYIAYEGGEFMEYSLIYEKDTTEENGMLAEIPIKDYSEFNQFVSKAQQKLAYYDTVALYIDNDFHENNIIRSEDWQYSSSNSNSQMHLCLKDVYYTIDFTKLGIYSINLPIALRFSLDSGITPTPSRESIIMNEATIKIIKEKIVKVANWFVDRYNSEWKEEESIITAWDKIGNNNKILNIAGKDFTINSIIKHSDLVPNELKIKGISIDSPEYYKRLASDALDEYSAVAEWEYKWKTKHINESLATSGGIRGWKLIEVNNTPTGRIKKFLLDKYSGNILFIKKDYIRKLGDRKADLRNNRDFRYILNLTQKPKETWRKLIVEYQEFVEKPFKQLIIDEKGVENSQEYQEWLVKYKEELKNNRVLGETTGNYQRLNKQEGQITLHYCVRGEWRSGYTFKKAAVDVKNIANNKNVVIYFPIEEKEKAKQVKELLGGKCGVCLVGVREINRLKEFTNFLNMEQLEKSKIFKRIASALLFKKEITKFDNLYKNNGLEIIKHVLTSFSKDVETLRNYVNNYDKNIHDNELALSILEVAETNKLFDYTLWTEYLNVKKNIEKYDFLNLLKSYNSWDYNEIREYKKLVNKLLYLKVKNKEIDDFEIVEKPKEEAVSITEENLGELIKTEEEVLVEVE